MWIIAQVRVALNTSIAILAVDGGSINIGVDIKVQDIPIQKGHGESWLPVTSQAGFIAHDRCTGCHIL
jgi:hypothetical protein